MRLLGGVCTKDLCANPGCGVGVVGITCRQENAEAFYCTCPGVTTATRILAGNEFGGCLDGTVPSTIEKVRDVPPERVEAKVLEHVDSATDVKVVEKVENRIVLDVTTDKAIDATAETQIKNSLVDALDLPGGPDSVHLDVVQKKRVFASTVTATIDEQGSSAFAVTGLVSVFVAILAALF